MEENRFTWNLEDIYPDEQAWYQDLSKAKELTAKLAAMQGKVSRTDILCLKRLTSDTKCRTIILQNCLPTQAVTMMRRWAMQATKSCMKPSAERTVQLPSRLPS